MTDPKLRRRYVYMSDAEWEWLKGQARERDVTISSLLRAARDLLEGDRKTLALAGLASGRIEDGRHHVKFADVTALKGAEVAVHPGPRPAPKPEPRKRR